MRDVRKKVAEELHGTVQGVYVTKLKASFLKSPLQCHLIKAGVHVSVHGARV